MPDSSPHKALDAASICKQACELELLDAKQLAELRGGKSWANAAFLAEEVVRRGWLTAFQVGELGAGRGAQLVLGQYALLEPLGQGGMGQVFKARHRLMRRTVALKVMREDLLARPEALTRFRREIELAAQLKHPNIVTAYDAEIVAGRHCLVMEYCDGKTLTELVQQIGKLPVGQACTYIHQAAIGLQHAHERDMIHRDIKPENLFLAEGTVKILDFGLARLRDPLAPESKLTRVGTIMGTPDFMAPEQALGLSAADARSDLYSLGCTFYFLLAGRVPFLGGTIAEKLLRQQAEDPPPLSRFRDDIPAEVQAIVTKLMAKDPTQRYQAARVLADELEPFAQYETPSTDCAALVRDVPLAEEVSTGVVATYHAPAPVAKTPGRSGNPMRLRLLPILAATALLVCLLPSVSLVIWLWPRDTTVTPPKQDRIKPDPIKPDPIKPEVARPWKWQLALKQETKTGQVRKVSLSPDGRWLAVAYGNRKNPKLVGSVMLWQVDRKALIEQKSWSAPTVATAVAFSQDSKHLAWGLAESPKITLWDLNNQQETLIDGHRLGVASLAFTPDNLLVASTWDLAAEPSTIGVWSVPAGKALTPLTLDRGRAISLAFSGEGRRLAHATFSVQGIKLWDFPDRKGIQLNKSSTLGGTLDAAISADGKTVAASYGFGAKAATRSKPGIKLWDVPSGEPYLSLLYEGDALPHALVFTPDGKALVAAFEDKVVRVFSLDTKKEESVLEGHSSAIFGLDLSRDGAVLATASADGKVHVWFRSEK